MRRTTLLPSLHKRLATSLVAAALLASQAFAGGGKGDCPADAGTLSGFKPTDCLNVPYTAIGGIPNGDRYVPPGYLLRFLLTTSPDLTIHEVGTVPVFTVTEIGLYNVHTIVFDPNTFDLGSVELGVTTADEVNALLLQGGGDICASLDMVGTSILVDNPDAGSLQSVGDPCFQDGIAVLTAEHVDAPYVPDGYSLLYVLTQGNDLVILDVGAEPVFSVTQEAIYTIHTLVYDPLVLDLSVVEFGVTTGYQVNAMLYQGGGNICASLDGAGTKFSPKDCPDEECLANAGTLSSNAFEACLEAGAATISATQEDAPAVPDGFSVLYVLTSGETLVIEQVNATPSFEVTAAGLYTIHTLVYDPNTLDLSVVVFGETTGGDVLGIVAENGICASLDVEGAPVLITGDCEPEPCLADAGTLEAEALESCLEDGVAMIGAMHAEEPNVPDGFSVLYVLTSGETLVIEQVNATPSFEVTAAGLYTIHTLVYDPNTLDLSVVVFGETTGGDVLGIVAENGICASLDVEGAPVLITGDCEPEPCLADAGTLEAEALEACLEDGVAMIGAMHAEEPNVPDGFSVLYVLTSGETLVIEQVNATPSFEVTAAGLYTIHTLVYDPNTLDLSVVVFGETTGGDVLGIVAENGICASLDVEGAPVLITGDCEPEPCLADAGTLAADAAEACLTDGAVIISATPNGDAFVPEGFASISILTTGDDLVIVGLNDIPSFGITAAGSYRLHTLVYDPATVDPNDIVIGETTAIEVLGIIESEDICASLDAAGAVVLVIGDCPSEECEANAGTVNAVDLEVCVVDGVALVQAVQADPPFVPEGHVFAYVLTKGTALVVEDIGVEPSFVVTAPEEEIYTVHGFVFDPLEWDPLAIIEVGTTTGADVVALIDDLGLCASLDANGAKVQVNFCEPNGLVGASLSITAWPNPARDMFTMEVTSSTNSRVEYAVFDHTGRQVTATQAVPMGVSRVDIDVLRLRPGQYNLRVITEATVINHAFLRMD